MKGSDRWTQELELRLVKLYKKFHCLWMMTVPSYNDLGRRSAAYVTIVETLKSQIPSLTVPKVVYKIRDLRHRYCVELTKMKGAYACGEDYTPNSLWFKVMHNFLDLELKNDGVKDSEGGITYSVGNVEPRSTSTCRTIYKSHLKMEESKSTVGEFEESGNDVVNCSTDDVCSEIRRGCMEAEESGRVRKIEDLPVQFPEIKRRRQKYSSDIKMTEFDEFNAFAVSIGSQLKRLDPALVKELEIRIMPGNRNFGSWFATYTHRWTFYLLPTTHMTEKGSAIIPSTLSPNDPTIRGRQIIDPCHNGPSFPVSPAELCKNTLRLMGADSTKEDTCMNLYCCNSCWCNLRSRRVWRKKTSVIMDFHTLSITPLQLRQHKVLWP